MVLRYDLLSRFKNEKNLSNRSSIYSMSKYYKICDHQIKV